MTAQNATRRAVLAQEARDAAPASIHIPGLECPPSLNNAYTNGRGHGRRVLTTEARRYKEVATVLIRHAAAAQGFSVPQKTPVRLAFVFYFDNVQRDGDNAVKLIQDALSEALGFNDRWVVASQWEKRIDKQSPRCDVTVEVTP